MTTFQKTILGAALAIAVGAAVLETRQMVQLRKQNQALERQQAPLATEISQLQRERDEVSNRAAALLAENRRSGLNSNEAELLKLRGEIGALCEATNEIAKMAEPWQDLSPQSVLATNLIPRQSWGFAGYATPEASLQSLFWAKSVGDVRTFLNSACPDLTNAIIQSYLKQDSDEERSKFLVNQSTNWLGFQILNEIPVSDDRMMVHAALWVQAPGGAQSADTMMILKRVNGEWKYFNEYNSPGFRKLPPN